MLVSILQQMPTTKEGSVQIRVKGERVFTLLEVIEDMPDKLYRGAIVQYPQNDLLPKPALYEKVYDLMVILFELSDIPLPEKLHQKPLLSYDVVDFLSLNLAQKMYFLSLLREDQRLEYLRKHLTRILPLIKNSISIHEQLEQNGFSLDNFSLN